jgi:hypothetical protein
MTYTYICYLLVQRGRMSGRLTLGLLALAVLLAGVARIGIMKRPFPTDRELLQLASARWLPDGGEALGWGWVRTLKKRIQTLKRAEGG